MKQSDAKLEGKAAILEALKRGTPVFADCDRLPERLPVKNVKTSNGIIRVLVAEGWRTPVNVYIGAA